MFTRFANRAMLLDVRSMLLPNEAERLTDAALAEAFDCAFAPLMKPIPGDPRIRANEFQQRLSLRSAPPPS